MKMKFTLLLIVFIGMRAQAQSQQTNYLGASASVEKAIVDGYSENGISLGVNYFHQYKQSKWGFETGLHVYSLTSNYSHPEYHIDEIVAGPSYPDAGNIITQHMQLQANAYVVPMHLTYQKQFHKLSILYGFGINLQFKGAPGVVTITNDLKSGGIHSYSRVNANDKQSLLNQVSPYISAALIWHLPHQFNIRSSVYYRSVIPAGHEFNEGKIFTSFVNQYYVGASLGIYYEF
jgi:hypothetical protein